MYNIHNVHTVCTILGEWDRALASGKSLRGVDRGKWSCNEIVLKNLDHFPF